MKYKVLLIDDQIENKHLDLFMISAEDEGIEIVGEKFHEEGMNLLKNDKDFEFQAVILDAAGYWNKEELDSVVNNSGLYQSLQELGKLRALRHIPWFVYTGEPKNKDNQEFFSMIKNHQKDIKYGRKEKLIYIKSEDDFLLLEDIKNEIDRLSNTALEYQYSDAFDALKKLNLNEKHHDNLFQILQSINDKSLRNDFTLIRKVIESIFKKLSDVAILPQGFTKESGWITGAARFISGKHAAYDIDNETVFNATMAHTLERVLYITQDASHNEGALQLKVDDFLKKQNTGYLYKSVVYGFLEVLVFWGDIYSNNKNKEINKLFWKKKSREIVGTIIELGKDNGHAFLKSKQLTDNAYIEGRLIKKYNLKTNQEVKAEVGENDRGFIVINILK